MIWKSVEGLALFLIECMVCALTKASEKQRRRFFPKGRRASDRIYANCSCWVSLWHMTAFSVFLYHMV